MPDPIEPVIAPEVAPVVEKPAEAPKPAEPFKFKTTKSMASQVDSLLKSIPEEVKPDEKPKDVPVVEEPKKDEPTEEPVGAVETPDNIQEPVELPNWQKYIIDNLPDIQVVGHEGESGKDKTYTVKRLQDLPDEFEFASRRAELAFMAANSAQEINARELLTKYQQQESQNNYQALLNQQALEVQSDITALQNEGLLEKFQYDTNDAKFNDDPAVKEANAIYALMDKRNKAYIANRQTYRISYRDAAELYLANKPKAPDQSPDKEKEPKPKTEAIKQERKQIAETNAQGATDTVSADKKAIPMPRGSNMRDVLKLYNAGRI